MSKLKAKYCINEFLEACKEAISTKPAKVGLEGWVLKTAAKDFNIKTRKALLEFIVYDGLEGLEFVNSKVFEISDEIPPPFCDGYTFSSGFTKGYIAFFFSEVNQRWIIKSFHRSDDCGETAFAIAFKKVGWVPTFGGKGDGDGE